MIEQTILSGNLELKAAIIAPEHPQAAVVFVHGMAALIAGNRVQFTEKEVKGYITKAYEGFLAV